MTLNGVMTVNMCYSTEFGSFEDNIMSKWLKIDPYPVCDENVV